MEHNKKFSNAFLLEIIDRIKHFTTIKFSNVRNIAQNVTNLFVMLNFNRSFRFCRHLMTNRPYYCKICKKRESLEGTVDMVDIPQSNKLINTTRLAGHLRGIRDKGGHLRIFVDLFSTWIHRVGRHRFEARPLFNCYLCTVPVGSLVLLVSWTWGILCPHGPSTMETGQNKTSPLTK